MQASTKANQMPTSRVMQPATSRCVCDVYRSMNLNPRIDFRPRW